MCVAAEIDRSARNVHGGVGRNGGRVAALLPLHRQRGATAAVIDDTLREPRGATFKSQHQRTGAVGRIPCAGDVLLVATRGLIVVHQLTTLKVSVGAAHIEAGHHIEVHGVQRLPMLGGEDPFADGRAAMRVVKEHRVGKEWLPLPAIATRGAAREIRFHNLGAMTRDQGGFHVLAQIVTW